LFRLWFLSFYLVLVLCWFCWFLGRWLFLLEFTFGGFLGLLWSRLGLCRFFSALEASVFIFMTKIGKLLPPEPFPSVSISHSFWPTSTLSSSDTNHWVIVPASGALTATSIYIVSKNKECGRIIYLVSFNGSNFFVLFDVFTDLYLLERKYNL
jgi:hypothetical protein